MRKVIRSIPVGNRIDDGPAGYDIMYVCPSLGPVMDPRHEYIVIDQVRAVVHLGKKIRKIIVVAYIRSNTGSLCHPVYPDPLVVIMQAVMADNDINGTVEFDGTHLGPRVHPFCPDIINMVAGHRTECTSHAAAHAGLPAVECRSSA